MEIEEDPDFLSQLEFEWHTRRDIVASLIESLKGAAGIDDLSNVVPCEAHNNYYHAGKICKLYFIYYPDENKARLVGYKFRIAS